MYRDIPQELVEVIEPIAQDHGLEVVEADLAGGSSERRLRVVLDTPLGDGRVTLDQCATVSRELGHALDASGVAGSAFSLEVMSPGVDRVLGREVDFERAVGRRVEFETRSPLNGQRRFRGELVAFAEERATFLTEAGELQVPFSAIARAKAFDPVLAEGPSGPSARGRGRRGKG